LNIGQRVVEIVIKGHDASVAAFKSLQANATESKKKLSDLANEIPGLSRAMALLTNPIAATAAIVVGLGVAMTKAYNATVQLGASFQDMSRRTDLSVESLAKWKYIAEQNLPSGSTSPSRMAPLSATSRCRSASCGRRWPTLQVETPRR